MRQVILFYCHNDVIPFKPSSQDIPLFSERVGLFVIEVLKPLVENVVDQSKNSKSELYNLPNMLR